MYIIGGIVSGHQSYMSSTVLRTRVSTGAHLSSADLDDAVEELEEVVEADLTRRVLLLTQIVDYRTNSTVRLALSKPCGGFPRDASTHSPVAQRGAGKPDEKLELALMAFFHNFRRAYIGVQHGMPEPLPGQPEGAAAHPIGPSPKQKVRGGGHSSRSAVTQPVTVVDHSSCVACRHISGSSHAWGWAPMWLSPTSW